MKVVVNSTFGGFGLSVEALKLMVIRRSKFIHEQKIDKVIKSFYKDEDFTIDLDDGFKGHTRRPFIRKDGIQYSHDDCENSSRVDPVLIEIVEKLGKKSYGRHAELSVVEIPDDIKWYIRDNEGGWESIEEEHRSWYATSNEL